MSILVIYLSDNLDKAEIQNTKSNLPISFALFFIPIFFSLYFFDNLIGFKIEKNCKLMKILI